MSRHFTAADIRELASDDVCFAAAQASLDAETAGRTRLPPRVDTPSGAGFLRVMPAVLDDVMGLKVMTLAEGLGTRYLVLLYDVASGELLAVFDADELTRLRTATYTAVAARLMVSTPPTRLGLVGSGFEAEGHLRALSRLWPIVSATVFSRSPDRRADFAARMSAELGFPVVGSPSVDAAVAQSEVVVLATKSKEPVLDGKQLRQEAVVLSIGSTRPDLRELDRGTLARSGTVVVDDRGQVMAESGDVLEGLRCGDLEEARLVPVSQVARDPSLLRREPGRDLLTFKSVGTALQDLALARAVLQAGERSGHGRELGELASLKPFAGAAERAGAAANASGGR